jgi:divalent metal cation (Fe/Co/Zn/Cd) transporter
MAKFKIYAYLFGGVFLIYAMIINIISEWKENHSFYSIIFNAVFIFIGVVWIKEGLKKRKELNSQK